MTPPGVNRTLLRVHLTLWGVGLPWLSTPKGVHLTPRGVSLTHLGVSWTLWGVVLLQLDTPKKFYLTPHSQSDSGVSHLDSPK